MLNTLSILLDTEAVINTANSQESDHYEGDCPALSHEVSSQGWRQSYSECRCKENHALFMKIKLGKLMFPKLIGRM